MTKRRLYISIFLTLLFLLFLVSGCTYRSHLVSRGKENLSLGEFEKAELVLTEVLKLAPKHQKANLYLGFTYLYQDRLEEAVKALQISLEQNKEPDLEYLGLGQVYLALGEYELATENLEKARQVDTYPVADYLLGFIYLKNGDPSKARQSLNMASKVYPSRGEIWAALGKLALENLQILDAAQAYQMAYVYGIRNFDLYLGLSEAYYQLGNYRQAVAVTEQALAERHFSQEEREEFHLKLAQYNVNQNPAKAIESFEAILSENPYKAEVLLMLGQLYFEQEQYEKTLEVYGIFLKKYSPFSQILHSMYRSHLALGNRNLAEKYLKDTIEMKDDYLPYYFELLNLYEEDQRWDDVVLVYQQALKLAPEDLELLNNYIGVLFKLKQYDSALVYLERAIKLQPNNIQLHLTKAYTYFWLHQKEQEIITYQGILKFAPDHLLTINNLAQIYRDEGKWEDAFLLYQKAVELNPNEGRYHRNLGYIRLAQGDYEGARGWLQKAIQKNSEDHEAYRFLGDTYFGQDEYQQAIKYYTKSLEIKEDYYYAMYPLGKAYFFIDELEKAKPYFKAYLERYPLNEGSKFYLKRIEWLKDQ